MAIGDITSPSISVDGKQLSFSAEGLDNTAISGFESEKAGYVSPVSKGYNGSSLDDFNRLNLPLSFNSIVSTGQSSLFTDTATETSDTEITLHSPDLDTSTNGWSTNGDGVITAQAVDTIKCTTAPATEAMAWMDAGAGNTSGVYSLDIYNGTKTSRWYNIIFRYVDSNNYWKLRIKSRASEITLYTVIAGVETPVGVATNFETVNAGTHSWRILLDGNDIRITVDGNLIFDETNSTHNTSLLHGFALEANHIVPTFDNVSFTTVPTGSSIVCNIQTEYIYDLDVSTLTLDAGLLFDGVNLSNAVVDLATTNASTLDYPIINSRLVGVLNDSKEIGVQYSVLTGLITAEALAFGMYGSGQPAAAVKFELTDGTTTLSATVSFMVRSEYNPTIFYDSCVASGFVASDPYAANSGGSGVFANVFDTTLLLDGDATLTITAYPVVGDAASIRTESWAMYVDNSSSLTQSTVYCDSRASVPHSGVTGTFTANERVDAATSGAILRFRYEAAGVLYFSAMDNDALVSGDVLTGVDSIATCTTSSTATYNGASGNAGTSISPKRCLWGSVPTGALNTKYNMYLMGDTSNQSHYSLGRSTTGAAVSTWITIQPDIGLTKLDIYVQGREGSTYADSRDKRIHFEDVYFWQGLQGDDARDTALLLHDCKIETFGGLVFESGTWDFNEYQAAGGCYILNTVFENRDFAGVDQSSLVRNVKIKNVNEDGIRSCYASMEITVDDNASPDTEAHQDGMQVDDAINNNRVFYNIVLFNLVSGQTFLADNVEGASFVNILSINLDGAGVAESQYGNSAAVHTVKNVIFAHISFVNAELSHRFFAGSIDENAFLRYSVVEDFDGYDLTSANLHNHMLDSTDDELNVTSEINGNPWVNGVSPDVNDNPSKRNYTPSAAILKNRIPAGQRYTPFDLFGVDVPNDGTGAIGALQVLATLEQLFNGIYGRGGTQSGSIYYGKDGIDSGSKIYN